MATIDLHMHSTFSSDGEFTPTQIINMSLKAGLTHAAIADHNSVRGIPQALLAVNDKNMTLIPAVELDCVHNGVNLHVLGYGIDFHRSIFDEIESSLHKQDQKISGELIRLVRKMGIEFSDEVVTSLACNGVVTGEMVAEAALLFDKKCQNPILDPYRDNGSRSDNPFINFYNDFCSQGKPAYVPRTYPSLEKIVQIIHSTGGVSILAHPGLNVRENIELLTSIIKNGVRGLEVFSSYHTQAQTSFYRNYAESHDFLLTCGSDFHGKTKPMIKIGSTDCHNLEKRIILDLQEAMSS